MLAKKFRLNARTSFPNARILSSPLFTIKLMRNGYSYSRCGFVVSKRVDKRAVVRNRTKRRIRSCFEQFFARIVPGYDMLIIVKRGIGEEKTQTVCQTLERLLIKNGLLTQSAPIQSGSE